MYFPFCMWGGVVRQQQRKGNTEHGLCLYHIPGQQWLLTYSRCCACPRPLSVSSEELPHGTAWRTIEAGRAAAVAAGNAVDLPMRLEKYQLRKEAELQESNIHAVTMPNQAASSIK